MLNPNVFNPNKNSIGTNVFGLTKFDCTLFQKNSFNSFWGPCFKKKTVTLNLCQIMVRCEMSTILICPGSVRTPQKRMRVNKPLFWVLPTSYPLDPKCLNALWEIQITCTPLGCLCSYVLNGWSAEVALVTLPQWHTTLCIIHYENVRMYVLKVSLL